MAGAVLCASLCHYCAFRASPVARSAQLCHDRNITGPPLAGLGSSQQQHIHPLYRSTASIHQFHPSLQFTASTQGGGNMAVLIQADDFSGAAEVAQCFAQYGFGTRILLEPSSGEPARSSGSEVTVV